MPEITVASPLLTEIGSTPLTPAQRAAVWELAAVLDERHIPIPEDPSRGDAVWVKMDTQRLRGSWGRSDNVWLRELLRRLEGVRLGGRASSDAWGGVLIAQWRIEDGGRAVSILLPPGGLAALRAPQTFAKIDAEAAHRLPPHARTLYGLLADKKRQKIRRWRVELPDLKAALGVADKYEGRFNNFKRFALDPAVKAINDFGVISASYEVERIGRQVEAVVFAWDLKDLGEAGETARENDRHSKARRKKQTSAAAPDLIPEPTKDEPRIDDAATAVAWADALPTDERNALYERHHKGPTGHYTRSSAGWKIAAWEAAGRPQKAK